MLRSIKSRSSAILGIVVIVALLAGCAQAVTSTPTAAPKTAATAPAGPAPTKAGEATKPAAASPTPAPAAAKPAAPTGTPYKIGGNLMLSVTGGTAIGQDYKAGMDSATEMINAAGGINGRPIQVVYYDNENSQDKALQLAKKMIQEDKILGMVTDRTAQALALGPLVEESGVVLINATGGYDATKGKKWVFQNVPREEIESDVLSEHLKNNLKVKSFALIHDENQYGTTGAKIHEEVAAKKGLKVTANIAYNNNSPDLSTEVTRAKASGAEALVIWGIPPGPANIAKAARNMGWNVPLVGSVATANPVLIDLAGKAVDGMTFTAWFDTQNPDKNDKPFVDAYKKKFNKTPGIFAALGWDSVLLLAEGIKKGGDDRAKVRDALENLKGFVGVVGEYNMSPTEHNGLTAESILLTQIKDGKWTVFKQTR
ncbi:MAG: ABC transporter substrate-binding protein [Chloroflexi bacterium]|nr:ABC transporter substrate-binding protein [Chloroflexota bacterium]MDA8189056.1 ABC transporter substrate-binding protein [Dehalococcoidales bacterium]